MLVEAARDASLHVDERNSTTASLLAGVTTVVIGGQLPSRRLEAEARDCMPRANFVQTYACTEAGSTITFAYSPPLEHAAPTGSAATALGRGYGKSTGAGTHLSGREHTLASMTGNPGAHVEIRVVECGLSHTAPVISAAPGVVGEIETRGPHVMKGYWGRPELTIEVLRPDGWLRTGDLGCLDERSGHLRFVGRIKDVIKTGGENVYASEVEDVLLKHDWVAEAAAYGVEDERLGEKVAASVVLVDAVQDETGVITCDRAKTVLNGFCGMYLSHYKRPRRIDIVPALPRNSAGKVLRHRLRASL